MAHDSALSAPAGLPAADVRHNALPLAQRVRDVFIAPVRLSEHLRDRPEWMGPLLLSVAIGVLTIILLPDQVLYDGMAGATSRRGKELAEITSDPATVALWERLRLSMGVIFTQPVKAWLVAGALMLGLGRLFGGATPFWHYLAVTTHALLISALGALCVLPLQIARMDGSVEPTLALLVPGMERFGALGQVLASINPFTVWMLAVLAIGVATLERRRSPALPLGILLGVYGAVLIGITVLTG
jgi:hypothetical protein